MSVAPLARIAGPLAIVTGGLVVITRLVIMFTIPAELGEPLRASVLSTVFAINSVASILTFALLALTLVALYEWEAREAGWFGVIGVGAALVGTMFMAGDWWYEAFAVPWLADAAPVVFETGAGGRLLIGGLSSFALFSLGWVIFGAASLRAHVYPRAISGGDPRRGPVRGHPDRRRVSLRQPRLRARHRVAGPVAHATDHGPSRDGPGDCHLSDLVPSSLGPGASAPGPFCCPRSWSAERVRVCPRPDAVAPLMCLGRKRSTVCPSPSHRLEAPR